MLGIGLGLGSWMRRWYSEPVRELSGVLITLARGYFGFLFGDLVGFLFISGLFFGLLAAAGGSTLNHPLRSLSSLKLHELKTKHTNLGRGPAGFCLVDAHHALRRCSTRQSYI